MIDKVFNFLMNVLPDVYICTLRKKGASLKSTKVNIVKIRISVESGTVKHLKAFRVMSSEMPISLLILS